METVNLRLKGMSCASCATQIEKAIRGVPGVEECSLNFSAQQARVKYNPRKTELDRIQTAVSDAGYTAELLQELKS
ncbi:heavy-metal-associated domain-containing protein [Laspinema sp. A4]|uniref:heavy-metal-associated domain-containing protein n=1 Tax=Laspinema sp. D2d TaxID=2953686 RepID=UPI0021BA4F1C|nr:heavy metal-associated domain-containing protein [Laspinema sp. D2d]MCT7985437.1 heavy-metal-associated domain-containing protein [Laspinema sp. D2d]